MPKLSPRLFIVVGVAILVGNSAVQYTVTRLLFSPPNINIPLLLTVNLLGSFVFVFGLIVFFLGVYRWHRGRRSDLTIDIL